MVGVLIQEYYDKPLRIREKLQIFCDINRYVTKKTKILRINNIFNIFNPTNWGFWIFDISRSQAEYQAEYQAE